MWNPFDLRGPEFLVFYTLLGFATLLFVDFRRRANETDAAQRAMLNDYLDIAYLRGGENEALRVATLNLVNRGLIEVLADDLVRTRDPQAISTVSNRLERRILDTLREPTRASAIFSESTLTAAAAVESQPTLMNLGLLPDEARSAARLRLFGLAVFVLAAVAITRILISIARGRTNILYLVAEAAIFGVLAYTVTHPRRTAGGDAVLADLRALFFGLKERAHSLLPGADFHDFALLVAVFGMSAMPPSFAFGKKLFPKPNASFSSGDGSGSSSCGSSCGGGGGGGCGGGCGGCGS